MLFLMLFSTAEIYWLDTNTWSDRSTWHLGSGPLKNRELSNELEEVVTATEENPLSVFM